MIPSAARSLIRASLLRMPFNSSRCSSFEKVANFHENALKMFEFDENCKDVFRPKCLKSPLEGHHTAAYGGLIVAQSLACAQKTLANSKMAVHSLHSYFILNVDTKKPIDYRVKRVRDGRSFATRTIEGEQEGKCCFVMQASFHVEERDSIVHQASMPKNVPKPEELLNLPDALNELKRKIESGELQKPTNATLWRLKRFEQGVYATETDLFEMRCTDISSYFGYKSTNEPKLMFWMRAKGDLPKDDPIHDLLLAYNSDSTMASTPMSPHYSLNNFAPSMLFSLDHCIYFHRHHNRADDWFLFESDSTIAANGRAFVQARVWTKDGELVMSCQQEVIVRTRSESASRI